VVGKYIGDNALAAVGSCGPIVNMLLVLFIGISAGASIMVSQYFGARNRDALSHTIGSCITATAICSILLILVATPLIRPVLVALNTPASILEWCVDYLSICLWGIAGLAYYNILSGILRGLGDSFWPLVFLLVATAVNIVLDIVFVAVVDMGVAGVAWATFICQGISAVLALTVVMRRLKTIEAKGPRKLFSWSICGKIARIAIPSILQQSFISVGNIILQGVINGFGPGVMAGYSAAIKLNNLVITAFTTLGNGISNYCAQNIGAGKLRRIPEGFRAGIKMVWLLSLPLAVLYFTCGRWLLLFFMSDPSADALHAGIMLLRIVSPFYFVISAKLVADGILRGASYMGRFMAATFTDLILRVVLAILFSGTKLGATGIWCAWPVGWSVATCISIFFYLRGPWNRKEQLS
jgi:putative MATE family efflux protein